MKKTLKNILAVIPLLAGAAGAYAQGYIDWGGYVRTGCFAVTVWSPNSNNVPLTGDTAIDFPVTGPYGIVITPLNNASNAFPLGTNTYPATNGIYTGIYYDGIPIGGSGDTNSIEGIYGDGSLWNAAYFAVPGTNNTAGMLAAITSFTPYTTTTMEVKTSPAYIGVINASENGADISGVWPLDHNRPPGTCTSPSLPGIPGGTAATVQILVWYAGPNGLNYAQSPIVGMSACETIDSVGTNNSKGVPDLGAIGNTNNPTGGGDTNYPLIQSFSLVNVVPPQLSATKQGTNIIITVTANSAFGINPLGDGNGALWDLITSTNPAAPQSTWSTVQTGMMPAALTTLTSFTITNGITAPGVPQYFALLLPDYPTYP